MGDVRNVLFVCSTLAQSVFEDVAKNKSVADKWHAETAGIGLWQRGCTPDDPTLLVFKNNGAPHKFPQREVINEDFDRFDYIFAMDTTNLEELRVLKPKGSHKAQVFLLGLYDPENEFIIKDAFYHPGNVGFYDGYHQLRRSCTVFLDRMSTPS